MKLTLEMPVTTALAFRTLVNKAKTGDPKVVELMVQLATDHGIDVTKIKLT